MPRYLAQSVVSIHTQGRLPCPHSLLLAHNTGVHHHMLFACCSPAGATLLPASSHRAGVTRDAARPRARSARAASRATAARATVAAASSSGATTAAGPAGAAAAERCAGCASATIESCLLCLPPAWCRPLCAALDGCPSPLARAPFARRWGLPCDALDGASGSGAPGTKAEPQMPSALPAALRTAAGGVPSAAGAHSRASASWHECPLFRLAHWSRDESSAAQMRWPEMRMADEEPPTLTLSALAADP